MLHAFAGPRLVHTRTNQCFRGDGSSLDSAPTILGITDGARQTSAEKPFFGLEDLRQETIRHRRLDVDWLAMLIHRG